MGKLVRNDQETDQERAACVNGTTRGGWVEGCSDGG